MRFPFAPTDHFGWAGQWGLYSGLSLDLSGKRWFWAEFFTPPKIQNGVNGHEPAFKNLELMTGQQRTMGGTCVWVKSHPHNSNNTYPTRGLSYRPIHSHLGSLELLLFSWLNLLSSVGGKYQSCKFLH
jgi:hypothetical protein